MSTLRQKHSHLYAPKTVEIRLKDGTPFEVPPRRNLILKVYTDTAAPILKFLVDPAKAWEGDRVLVENIPGTSEAAVSIVFGGTNTVAGSVAAKKDETFRLVGGLWLLEPPSGEGQTTVDWDDVQNKPTEFVPEDHDASKVTSGVLDNARVNFGSPAPIGDGVPNSGAFTSLSTTGTATLPHIHGSIAGNLYVHVRNDSGLPLLKGTPVYATGSVGNTDIVLVGPANQASTSTMPALGLLEKDLIQNEDGNCIILGELKNFNTNAYTINQELFVGNGVITPTKQTTGEVQSVGVVSRVQQNTGTIVVNMQSRRTPDAVFSREVTKYTYIIPNTTTLFQIPPLEYKNSLVELILERGDATGITIRLPLSFPQKALLQTIIRQQDGDLPGPDREQVSLQYPQDDAGTSWANYKQYDGPHFPFYVDHFIGKLASGLPWAAYFPGKVSELILPCGAASPGTSGPVGYWGIPSELSTITAPNQNRREFEVGRPIRVLGAQLVQDVGGTLGIGQGPSVDPSNPFLSIHYNPGSFTQLYDLGITNPNYTVAHNVTLSPPANSLKNSGTLGSAFPNPQFSGVFDLLPGRRYTVRIKWPTFSGIAPTTVRNTLILYYIDPYESVAGLLATEAQYVDFLKTQKI